ncbi:MAG TPA: NAD(P)-dependent oxidoreductase [Candidatus Baltobacteraceae bacterium]|nr:NAD(P)-dependent oxidoreductase [Candidatus Baltobacteraceae bacterium]
MIVARRGPSKLGANARVLVTGGSGYLGAQVLRELGAAAVQCHALSRTVPPPEVRELIAWHRTDLLADDVSSLLSAIRPTHCIHLAWEATPGQYRQSLGNYDWVAATLRLARSFFSAGGRHFTSAGSCLEYAQPTDACDEATTPIGGDCPYAICKIEISRLLAALARDCKASFADGRIFYLYGPGEPAGKLIRSICQGLIQGHAVPLTSGLDFVDFVYRDDAAKALLAMTGAQLNGAFNIGTGRGILVRELATRLGEIADKAHLLQFGKVPLGREPARIVAATSRLISEVGYRPLVEIDEGLHRCFDFWAAAESQTGAELLYAARK